MTLDKMTGITEGSYTGFCTSQLITCNRVKECNGVCPFEDALQYADQTADEQNVIDHDRDWIIGCIEHDGFIHTARFDKANRIILEALQTDVVRCKDCRHRVFTKDGESNPHDIVCDYHMSDGFDETDFCSYGERRE